MKLLLKPTIRSLRNDYEENDFTDEEQFEEEILVSQGFEAEEVDVEDGEEFEIPVGKCACIIESEKSNDEYISDDDEDDYKLCVEVDDGVCEEEPIRDNLQSGLYKLDGHLIKVIELYEE